MKRFALVVVLLFAADLQAAKCKATTFAETADAIARGHAYAKHAGEFRRGRVIAGLAYPLSTVTSRALFGTRIEEAMRARDTKPLANKRRAYWHASTGTVVITNRNAKDCGTAFRPDNGRRYYENLR